MSNHTIELNFKAASFEAAISRAIVDALCHGMVPREIIAQLIARGFLRDPGNNALEDVVRELADMADQLRRDPPNPTGQAQRDRVQER
jgi:hypothetical protein